MTISAPFYIIVSAILWGATVPIMKLALADIPPFSLALLRMAFATILFYPFVAKQLKFDRVDFPRIFWAALTGVTLNLSLFFFGLKYSQAIIAAFLIAAMPIFALSASHVFLKEKITKNIVLASILSLAGVVIIIGKPTQGFTIVQAVGSILLLGASLVSVVNEILAKKLLRKYKADPITFATFFIGAVTLVPLALIELKTSANWYTTISIKSYLALLYGIFFSSIVAYAFWHRGLARLSAGKAAFFFYLDPVTGAVFSILLLNETINMPMVVGAVLITLGVFMAEAQRKNHPLHK